MRLRRHTKGSTGAGRVHIEAGIAPAGNNTPAAPVRDDGSWRWSVVQALARGYAHGGHVGVRCRPLGGPACDRPADVHLLLVDDSGQQMAVPACTGHAAVAEPVAEHDLSVWCSLPDTRFDQHRNQCTPARPAQSPADDARAGAGGGAAEEDTRLGPPELGSATAAPPYRTWVDTGRRPSAPRVGPRSGWSR